jgi:hypothetical protein
MVDLFDTPEPLTDDQYKLIANLKYDPAGQSLTDYCKQKMIVMTNMLVAADPKDVGAMAQLQAQIACYSIIIQLIEKDYSNEETE